MKIITIIGTRPQYIKIKPLCDYFNNNKIENCLVDTNQHYSDNVSKNLIEELELKIDHNLRIKSADEISFLSNGIRSVHDKLENICDSDSVVAVIGDTNSTLISSIVAKKMGLKLVHIEAGIRCDDPNSPEEINRIMVDSIADIHFISRECDSSNVSNPVYVGDLEYNFLNSIEGRQGKISYDNNILLTIHRQENMNVSSLNKIFKFCDDLQYPIIFPIHHRTFNFVKKNNISIPSNIDVVDPVGFMEITSIMRSCRAIITDSGGITKTAPFFGKKVIVPMEKFEWDEVFDKGYATYVLDRHWFDDYKMERDMNLYYVENSCEIIANKILESK
jgi:UDP-GlcNAc3NAcA epimerase